MSEGKDLLAYCGFYCGDCFGHTGVIADATETFKQVLDRYRFGRTAEAVFSRQLGDYGRFYETLEFMTGLRCPRICREGEDGGPSSCEVRKCCRTRGYYACYECDGFERCDTLLSLHGGLHTASCLKNLTAIREMGLEAWLVGEKRHCYWLEEDGWNPE
jgi:hypothetical protein